MTGPVATERRAVQARVAAALAGHLDRHVERLGWDAGRLASYQHDQLRVLLAHAAEHSRFHARRLRGADLTRFELADLPRLPIMTKGQMMASFDDVVTDRRLGRSVVEAHLAASVTEPSLLFGEYVCLASGGSSGPRGIFVQTLSEYASFVASIVRRGRARLLAAGAPPAQGMVIGLVGAASPVHSSGFGAATAAAVREYQVRQTQRGIDVACAAYAPINEVVLAARLEQGLRRAGVAEPRVSVTVVDAIPRDPKTGKVRRFIPNPCSSTRQPPADRDRAAGRNQTTEGPWTPTSSWRRTSRH